MAGDSAIADVSQTLIAMLRDNLQDLMPPPLIVLASPGEINPQDSPCLCLFLYHIAENQALRNQSAQAPNSGAQQRPSLNLDLYYLLVSYGSPVINDPTERTLGQQKVLGRAMKVFQNNPVLTGSILKGTLAGAGQALRITLETLPVEGSLRVWNSFPGKSLMPSAYYKVGPVAISDIQAAVAGVDASAVSQQQLGAGMRATRQRDIV